MAHLVKFLTFLLSLTLFHTFQLVQSQFSPHHDSRSFNVLNYGAVGDGFSDDSKAFNDAWEDTCNYIGSQSTMEIPQGRTFLLQPVEFHGPCKSKKILLSINGNLIAPEAPYQWKCKEDHCHKWIEFAHINGLYIDGPGTLDGQGPSWWSLNCKKYKNACLKRPRGVVISHSSNVHISNIMVKDSPNFQMSLEDSKWVFVKKLTITADGDSPNTDGIHIQRSQNVFVYNSNIRTGDDCISIGDGSKYVNISRISCGPGHGISIGSLGRYGTKETVENVVVRDCTFRETTNGVRIKTWQGGRGYVRNVIFERIKLHGATRPIIIDQFYCPHSQCKNHTDALEIKNVMYNHIHGTSIKKPFVQLLCSKSVPCKEIFMNDINIHDEEEEMRNRKSLSHHDHHPLAECINVTGESNGVMKPKLACLESRRH
ncbi:Polygalacturonase QRT2 [Cardamine amara subsp. amara]|uniref:Polygalacturonase QRT2 n=1 Tax=Cardamine amara subsp. amara TaxID=228776 RepID=A0ABD1B2W3_CARAN